MSKKHKQSEPRRTLARIVVEVSASGSWERRYVSLTFLVPEGADLAAAAEAARAALIAEPGK